MSEAVLYDYWRSSSAYRVRIALALKGVAWRSEPIDLLAGEQRAAAHLARNPQGLVPALVIDGRMLTQSLAIIEYLDETRPEPRLLPEDAAGRHRVRALSYAIAMEIHPVCNQSVARHAALLTRGEGTVKDWMLRFIPPGLAAVEAMLGATETGRFCHGDDVTMADLCLVPQLYNARRWEAPLEGLPRIRRIAHALEALPAFIAAHPDRTAPARPAG